MTDAPTTAAMHTPPGRGGIAVIVLAGPAAAEIAARAFRPLGSHARGGEGTLQLGHVVDGADVLDEAVVARRGELVEFNIHGGPAAEAAVLGLLGRLGATVLPPPAAAPHCFPTTCPRLDNPAVGEELLAALGQARTPLAVSALSRQWSNGLSELARSTVERLDAALDAGRAPADGNDLAGPLRAAAGRMAAMTKLLTPAEVVLAGPPNVGKSTLANALVGRAVSIVHDRAGTTRDWVREPASFHGVPVWLTDTAGLWLADDAVDAEAVRRARQRVERADVVCLLSAAGEPVEPPDWIGAGPRPVPRVLRVATKTDLRPAPAGADAAVCAVTGAGLDDLTRRVVAALGLADFDPAAPAAFTPRQADLLHRAAEAIGQGRWDQARGGLRELLGDPLEPRARDEMPQSPPPREAASGRQS